MLVSQMTFGMLHITLFLNSQILPKLPRQAYYLNTKVGRYEKEYSKMFDFSAERVIRSVDESLQRLGAEYIDVIQIHDMEFAPSLDIIINETLPALQKVKEAGKVKHIGITGYPLENFRTVIDRSSVQIDSVLTYCHGSMNDNTLQEFLPYLQSKGVGIINASLLSMGLLTNRGPSNWHPASQEIRDVCKSAAAYCQSKGTDIARLATHFALIQPGIDTTLISTASTKNLQTNIDVLTRGITAEETQVMNEAMEKYFLPMESKNWHGVEVAAYWEGVRKEKSS
uniref:NADP-dependent oxidoreductase domain-containing protein n=1 Tax=Ciona savignyi TaxID=51511 RepID=H2ZLA0_CIOSA